MKLSQEIIDTIKHDSEQTFTGTEGCVYLCRDLALKEYYSASISGAEQLITNLDAIKNITNELKEEHFVNTPKVYDYYIKQALINKGYLLMERAKGSPVYASVKTNLITLCPEYKDLHHSGLISKYCLHMAEKLADGKQWQYDNFIEDARSIFEDGRVLVDKFGENIYYDENEGFSFLDLQKLDKRMSKDIRNNYSSALALIGLDYVSCLLCGINASTENVDPVKLVKPIFDKTMTSLNKHGVNNNNLPFYIKSKVRELM